MLTLSLCIAEMVGQSVLLLIEPPGVTNSFRHCKHSARSSVWSPLQTAAAPATFQHATSRDSRRALGVRSPKIDGPVAWQSVQVIIGQPRSHILSARLSTIPSAD